MEERRERGGEEGQRRKAGRETPREREKKRGLEKDR